MESVKIKFAHRVTLVILQLMLVNQLSVPVYATSAILQLINVLDVNLVKNVMVKQLNVKIYVIVAKLAIQLIIRAHHAISVQNVIKQRMLVYHES